MNEISDHQEVSQVETKKNPIFITLFLLLTFLCSTAAYGQEAQPAPIRGAGGKVSLDFKDIELTDLIQTISELTGKNFIYDDTVRGKATIISPEPISLDQAYTLFLTVLAVKGFTVVPSGKVNKIIQLKDAKESSLPVVTDGSRSSERYVTQLISLQHIDASLVATTVLAPLVPKTSSVISYPPSNSLIITDNASNIEKLVTIIKELDVPSDLDRLEVITLEYADAEEVAQIAGQVLSQGAAAPTARTARRRRVRRNVQTAPGTQETSRIIPYTRTNSLVIMANEEDLEILRGLIEKLDQKPTETRAGIYVYYLENADAETLAKTLNEIVTGMKTQARTATRPTPGQPQAPATPALETVAITADKPTNALIVNSTPDDYEILKEIIGRLDVKRKQVFVEALILELSMDATKRLGASLQGAIDVGSDSVIFGTSNLNTGSATLADLGTSATDGGFPNLLGRAIEGVLIGGLFSPIRMEGPGGEIITVPALSALIDLSKTNSDVNILSAPRLLTSDNEEAEIIVGSNVPVITQRLTDTGASTGLAQSVSVERQDVALTLRFTPQITEGNQVRLNVYQEITDLATSSVGDVNQVGPTFTKRLLRNTVLAENGRTVVLGGLIGRNVQNTVTKVPLLGDIPGLGWLFKRESRQERKTNLLIFITPKIIRNASDLALVTNKSRKSMEDFEQGILPTLEPEDFVESPAIEDSRELLERYRGENRNFDD